jgi:ubiquinone/menaquinone biosynthesis C-methylase UbiE
MITVDFNRLPIRTGHKILDIGCGSGRHTCAASRLEKVVVIGSDFNFDEVKEARKRLLYQEELGEHGGGIWATLVADITRLPFSDDFFDVVICSEVLEHIPDQHTAVYEVNRVLKPGGDLIVSVPRYLPERICWALSDS